MFCKIYKCYNVIARFIRMEFFKMKALLSLPIFIGLISSPVFTMDDSLVNMHSNNVNNSGSESNENNIINKELNYSDLNNNAQIS